MKHVNIKECEVCKTPFDALRSTKKTCSDACRKALQRLSYCDKNCKSDEKYQIGTNRENITPQPIEKQGFYVTVKPKSSDLLP